MEALRWGMSVAEFWDLTPAETFRSISAAGWRAEQAARRDVALAWHVAALSRSERLPSLSRLLKPQKTRVLKKDDLEKRKAEHAEMAAALTPEVLGTLGKGFLRKAQKPCEGTEDAETRRHGEMNGHDTTG